MKSVYFYLLLPDRQISDVHFNHDQTNPLLVDVDSWKLLVAEQSQFEDSEGEIWNQCFERKILNYAFVNRRSVLMVVPFPLKQQQKCALSLSFTLYEIVLVLTDTKHLSALSSPRVFHCYPQKGWKSLMARERAQGYLSEWLLLYHLKSKQLQAVYLFVKYFEKKIETRIVFRSQRLHYLDALAFFNTLWSRFIYSCSPTLFILGIVSAKRKNFLSEVGYKLKGDDNHSN